MRVIISARKGHSSPERFTHYMAVDEGRGFHGLLVDLSGLQHSMTLAAEGAVWAGGAYGLRGSLVPRNGLSPLFKADSAKSGKIIPRFSRLRANRLV